MSLENLARLKRVVEEGEDRWAGNNPHLRSSLLQMLEKYAVENSIFSMSSFWLRFNGELVLIVF